VTMISVRISLGRFLRSVATRIMYESANEFLQAAFRIRPDAWCLMYECRHYGLDLQGISIESDRLH